MPFERVDLKPFEEEQGKKKKKKKESRKSNQEEQQQEGHVFVKRRVGLSGAMSGGNSFGPSSSSLLASTQKEIDFIRSGTNPVSSHLLLPPLNQSLRVENNSYFQSTKVYFLT
jgi:hypothetical protein